MDPSQPPQVQVRPSIGRILLGRLFGALVIVAAGAGGAAVAWHNRVFLAVQYRRHVQPNLKDLAQESTSIAKHWSDQVLPPSEKLPDQPSAETLDEPDSSPEREGFSEGDNPEGLVEKRILEKKRMATGYLAKRRGFRSSTEMRAESMLRRKQRSIQRRTIGMDQEIRQHVDQWDRSDREIDYTTRMVKRMISFFFSIATFFGVLAWLLLGLKGKWYKTT